ncbi:UbiE/COQ5 methyltransferase [Candidatus Nitrosopumilus koreensis AR1]|uniref:UbiE/COQ5 methyltransferase n=1 Tax=Candidatus Nitrosopumilus koreensis AR1 TaxID=1229908 RepID=K0B5E1_9ARCH|nr:MULTISPECIES: methyltransferase domain-containing protein [Nitrosopumilus]AFS80679.1 UbiE/COQ5 methyltransferase [Candidatus Nitrosopumilus koreensis AR1]
MNQNPRNLVPRFFNDTAKTYDKIANWATFGQDKYWKDKIIQNIPSADSVLDLACGTGILTRMIAQKFPHAKITGVDISQTYLQIAKQNSTGFENISFVYQDAEELDLKEKFDCICSSYIPKYCDPKTLIQKCISHLNPKGTIILHDFIFPQNRLLQNLWNAYFEILLFAGNFVPSWKFAFKELPNLIRESRWVDDYTETLEKNNFIVSRHDMTWHTSSIIFAKMI